MQQSSTSSLESGAPRAASPTQGQSSGPEQTAPFRALSPANNPTNKAAPTGDSTGHGSTSDERLAQLFTRYRSIRKRTEELCAPLQPEDFGPQSMPDASPTKWHLGHTSWFFEVFVLERFEKNFKPVNPAFRVLFNSYYNSLGKQHSRPERGLLTRPLLNEVWDYRRRVDDRIQALSRDMDSVDRLSLMTLLETGLNHEQQHQELILTDIKHLFAQNPIEPAYRSKLPDNAGASPTQNWIAHSGGLMQAGHKASEFAFDNEGPQHRVFLEPFALADRLVSNADMLEFIADDGYQTASLWLDAGWQWVRNNQVEHPLYWKRNGDGWSEFTLAGRRALMDSEPACHLNFFEAQAFATWAGARLPTEMEWEFACGERPVQGNFADSKRFHPDSHHSSTASEGPQQLFGDVWEWTQSPYVAYPGYEVPVGAIGEYNGKFMCDQLVLRGGSCVSPRSHLRPTYRNFFPAQARWQFSGFRLAKSAS